MTLHTNLSFETATGSIDYPFTNDYMFRAILQKDKQVLKALIAALLHLKKESIHDVAITKTQSSLVLRFQTKILFWISASI